VTLKSYAFFKARRTLSLARKKWGFIVITVHPAIKSLEKLIESSLSCCNGGICSNSLEYHALLLEADWQLFVFTETRTKRLFALNTVNDLTYHTKKPTETSRCLNKFATVWVSHIRSRHLKLWIHQTDSVIFMPWTSKLMAELQPQSKL